MPTSLLLFLLMAQIPPGPCPASAASFTGARWDAPFFVFDGGPPAGPGFGQFDSPSAIAEIGGGLLAIADSGNHRIKTVTVDGFFQDFWGEEGDGPGQFRSPGALAAAGEGRVWVVDGGNHRLQLLQGLQPLVADLTGAPLRSVGRRGSGRGEFENPTGIAIGRDGRLLVVDSGNRRIQVLSAKGRTVDQWRDPELVEPWGIAVDPGSGRVFVSDRGAHRIVVFDRRGRKLAAWGERGAGAGRLESPHGLALHGGFLYVADTGNGRVVKMSPEGEFVAAVGCRGGEAGAFLEPVALAIDGDHHLYVVDRGSHQVQKLGHQ
jgi:tripartite motif-containing protein 71